MEPIEKLDRKNISSIETFFDNLFRGEDKLTKNLFFNELPTEIGKDWKDFVVVDLGNPLQDKDAYAGGTVLVLLYAKQNAHGVKNVPSLQKLEKALNRLVQENNDPYYHVSFRGRYSNYNAVNDIYFNVIQLNLVIT
ncbi:MAG: hypothetical protein J6Y20_04620 [Lachnospiraceae bacterium]|nr:hypothetical protein [Kiritimatiellia bacterium]MBP5461389.1 hypothetical protein [Lachnospiraceae bacterium]